jgi:Flp pilus assembly protein TadG
MSAIAHFRRRVLPGLSSVVSQFRRMATSSTANISILAGLTFIPFTIAVTAAVDMSNAIRIKSSLQAAADAGVLAATTALASGYGDTDKTRIATDTFFANLSPALMDAFPADPEVTIDFTTQTVHMSVSVDTDQLLTSLITDSITIGVQSTATADQGSPVCLMALNPTAWKSLNIQGTADVNALACAVQVNSDNAEAMRQTGSSYANAESFCIHGDYSGTNYSPTPRRHCMREQDPLAAQFAIDLAALNPDAMGCRPDHPKLNASATEISMPPSTDSGKGAYCGVVDVKNGQRIILQPGVHVFRNGGLNISASGELWGTGGVTILLTGDPTTRWVNQAGADVSITGPASGPFAGIVLAQVPTSIPSPNINTIIGGGYMNFNGIVYFPTQPLKITGNGDIGADSAQFAIMADTIDIEGNGTLYIHISSDAVGSGLPGLPQANEIIRLIQ